MLGACCLLLIAVACSSSAPSTSPNHSTTGSRTDSSTTSATKASKPTSKPSTGQVTVAAAPFSLPRPSARAVLVADGDHLLLLGGFDGAKRTISEILRIDPRARTVTNAGALVAAVHDAGGAQVGGTPMVFGGGNSSETNGVQAVGPTGVSVVGHLPIPRSDLTATTIGGRTFIIGGYDGARVRGTTISTSDGVTFQVLGDLPVPVRYPAVAALGARIYIVGGTTDGNASGAVRAVQMLDTTTGAARQVGELPQGLTDAVAATVRGHIYVFGGLLAGRETNQVWRLDPGPDGVGPVTLNPVATLPTPISDAAIAVLGNVAYLVGGESPNLLSSIITLEVR